MYKNYITLIVGELGLNPVMERFLNGSLPHPIATDADLQARMRQHYRVTLHRTSDLGI
jgi:hypothetical protein